MCPVFEANQLQRDRKLKSQHVFVIVIRYVSISFGVTMYVYIYIYIYMFFLHRYIYIHMIFLYVSSLSLWSVSQFFIDVAKNGRLVQFPSPVISWCRNPTIYGCIQHKPKLRGSKSESWVPLNSWVHHHFPIIEIPWMGFHKFQTQPTDEIIRSQCHSGFAGEWKNHRLVR